MLYRHDRKTINWIEKRCHAMQVRTGVTNFQLARAAHVLNVLCATTVIIFAPSVARQMVVAIAIMSMLYAKILWNAYGVVEEYYRSPQSTAHPHTKMWRSLVFARLQAGVVTAFCLCYGGFHWDEPERLALLYGGGGACWLAALYLQCVIPLPPSAHWEWKKARSQQTVSSEPAPNPTH